MKLQMHLLFSNPVLLLLLVLVSPATHAQEVVLSCDKEMHWGYISERSLLAIGGPVVLEGRERTMETVDTTKLDIVTKPDANGDVLRNGTRTTNRSCGPFTVVLSSGWLNDDPMGESGADDFSIFELRVGGKTVLGPLALGSCGPSGPSWRTCPSDWVTSISFQWGDRIGKPIFHLQHDYEEQREAP